MEPVPVFSGRVSTDGRLQADVPKDLQRYLRTLTGKHVDITVRIHRTQRSSKANRYYFGVVVAMLAEYCGYDQQDMHEALAMRFLRVEDCPITGAPRRKRTPNTNSKEFAEYVDACVRFAAELGVVVPEPGHSEAA